MTAKAQAARGALRAVTGRADAPVDDRALDDRPPIEVGSNPDAIRKLEDAIEGGKLPGLYVLPGGQLVHMTATGGRAVGRVLDDSVPLPQSPVVLTTAGLARLLARELNVFQVSKRRGGEDIPEEVTPPRDVLAAVLARAHWPKLPTLRGVIGAPVLRPNGTLLQRAGYDPETGYYLASTREVPEVPTEPTAEEVEAARRFVLDRFLRDFPWVSKKADRANYLGLLVTPILRPYLRQLTPFGIITATQPGSGKTILTAGPGLLYGQRVVPWPYADEELRKAITAVLQDEAGVVVFDNVAEGTVVSSPILAQLITSENGWSDRKLGSSKTLTTPNDRLWMLTGNNVRVGGDMASRTVLVRLDPDCPHPEERTGFALGDLSSWMANPKHQGELLHHLLVLVVDWTRARAPRRNDLTMRQFTAWAQAVGGFLDHHGVEGFLANRDAVRDADEDDMLWSAFLQKWLERFPHPTDRGRSQTITAGDLRRDAEMETITGRVDQWDGCFITTPAGRLPTAVALGRSVLPARVGRHHGQYVLRSIRDEHRKQAVFWVEVHS